MDQTFQGFDKATVFSIAGTLGLLVFGTLIYFSSFEKLTADGKGKKHGEGKRDIAYKPASSSVSTGDGRKDVASHNGDTIKSSSALIEATRDSSSKMKGYKITSDGRKTTYFNREMTEAEKILLGDSTPKQLMNNIPSSDGACFQSLSAKSASSVGSAWNTAGTWEERNHSPWASKRIKQLLTAASMDIVNKNASGTIKVTKIKSIEGDALITMVRGKKKFIYDFTISLEWTLIVGIATATGLIMISDVNAECDYEFDITTSPTSITPVSREDIKKYVMSKSDGLQLLMYQKLNRFFLDFKMLD